jgi:hypothetical protein
MEGRRMDSVIEYGWFTGKLWAPQDVHGKSLLGSAYNHPLPFLLRHGRFQYRRRDIFGYTPLMHALQDGEYTAYLPEIAENGRRFDPRRVFFWLHGYPELLLVSAQLLGDLDRECHLKDSHVFRTPKQCIKRFSWHYKIGGIADVPSLYGDVRVALESDSLPDDLDIVKGLCERFPAREDDLDLWGIMLPWIRDHERIAFEAQFDPLRVTVGDGVRWDSKGDERTLSVEDFRKGIIVSWSGILLPRAAASLLTETEAPIQLTQVENVQVQFRR